MRNSAAELGIHLLFIPPGLTDEMQPLDRFVFGVMKAYGRRMYRNCASSSEQTNKQVTAAFLVRAWKAVSTTVLDEAWATYDDPEVEDQ
jgi:hypothetical protein